MSLNSEANFWQRMGLQDKDRDAYVRAIEEWYPSWRVEEFSEQGYCSFTLLVSPCPTVGLPARQADVCKYRLDMLPSPAIVQLRPRQHALDAEVARAACKTYGDLAPSVRTFPLLIPGGLTAVVMDLKKGTPVSKLLSMAPCGTDAGTWNKHVAFIESLASFVSLAWPTALDTVSHQRHTRADSPMLDGPSWLAPCTGKVGREILSKLGKLSRQLPDSPLRERARATLDHLLAMDDFPIALNHGDLIPTNILADEETWEITGVIDWAEAEWLPFGTCLYGLDHLLGCLDRSPPSTAPHFRFHERADVLRRMFWRKLVAEAPGLGARLKDVLVMRDVGVFLWLGYAWDEGRIDRVVNEVDDADELARLRAFLDARPEA
jgi:hypothetical protein